MVNAQITSVSGMAPCMAAAVATFVSSQTACRYSAAADGIGRLFYAWHDGPLLHLTLLAHTSMCS